MYKLEGQIRFSECDTTKSITLPGIINYFQDCSSAQSEQIGHGIDYEREEESLDTIFMADYCGTLSKAWRRN